MEKLLYPTDSVRCIIIGPSECGKSVFSTNSILNISNEIDNFYIYSPALHQYLYKKSIKFFSNYIPIHILPNILKEENIAIVIDEVVYKKDFKNI